MTSPTPNLFVNWIASIPSPQRPALARKIFERLGQINASPGALTHQLNLASKLAFALFLEYAETKSISPAELKLLLDDPGTECLEAIVSFTIMHIGELTDPSPEMLCGDRPGKSSPHPIDAAPLFIGDCLVACPPAF